MNRERAQPNAEPAAPKILFIDDEECVQRFVSRNLDQLGYQLCTARHWDEAKEMFAGGTFDPDIIFVEPWSGGSDGLKSLYSIQDEAAQTTPIVVVSSQRKPGVIVEAIQNGATDYLVKPFELANLKDIIERILEQRSSKRAGDDGPWLQEPSDFVFSDKRMQKIERTIRRIAGSHVPVLIHGESGVGKDVIARQIFRHAEVNNRTFVKVNCAALPPDLTESELFGHMRGAFTGAHVDRPGKFEHAHGGTIFLDEIGEFPPTTQAKLLQVLQDGSFTRLGSNQEVRVDVRVIAATNRDLEAAIANKQFRSDLYYRLNVVNIAVPPLRERSDEIALFVKHFMARIGVEMGQHPIAPLPESLLEAFKTYEWPGNVRELENLVKRYIVLEDAASIEAELHEKCSRQVLESVDQVTDSYLDKLQQGFGLKQIAKEAAAKAEKLVISSALSRTKWNKWKAAQDLGVSYKTLLTRIEEYQIVP